MNISRRLLLCGTCAAVALPTLLLLRREPSILLLGDSMSEFNSVPDIIADVTGYTILPCSIGGTTVSVTSLAEYDALSGLNISKAFQTGDWERLQEAVEVLATRGDDNSYMLDQLQSADGQRMDALVLWYGTNDFMQATPLDKFSKDYAEVIELLRRKFTPRITVLVSPPHRWRQQPGDGLDSDEHPNTAGIFLREYVDVIEQLALEPDILFVDTFKSDINRSPNDLTASDGVHLDVADQIAAGKLIADKINSTIA